MATENNGPQLKYAIFCHDTEDDPNGELVLKGVIDLIDLAPSKENAEGTDPLLAELDVQLAFCISGAAPGPHHLLVAIKAPGAPLDLPPPQLINWEEGIIFQRWIKLFRIPVQRPGHHAAAILLDGTPLGEASFLVRLKDDGAESS